MQLLMQDPDSTVCGQCCVAMISDKTVEEVIGIVGNEKPMNLPLFKDVLDLLRINYEMKFFEGDAGYYDDYEGRGFMRVAMAEDKYAMGHAVAFENGKIYDPMNKEPFDNIFDLAIGYLKVTGEVWIVDFAIYTNFGEE